MADPEDALGNDIAAIRARVLGGRAGLAAKRLTHEERVKFDSALREEIQVDPDRNPEALRELEDADLLRHIDSQRQALKAYQKKMKEVPSRGDLNLKYVDAIGAMSELVRGLDADKLKVDDAAAMAHKRAEALASIKALSTPRNAPPNPFRALPEGGDEFFKFFEAEALKTSAEFDAANDVVKHCHASVFRLRREFTYVVDKLLERVDLLEEEGRRMRKIVRDTEAAR